MRGGELSEAALLQRRRVGTNAGEVYIQPTRNERFDSSVRAGALDFTTFVVLQSSLARLARGPGSLDGCSRSAQIDYATFVGSQLLSGKSEPNARDGLHPIRNATGGPMT
jgi:hypothetical protein